MPIPFSAGGTKIVLIDGKRLVSLMMEYNVGVYVKYTYEIKAIDENFFEEVQHVHTC